MKATFIILSFVLLKTLSFGQDLHPEYLSLTETADSLYNAKDYKNSASTYNKAFQIDGAKVTAIDRYNAACSWALANYPDSAFSLLNYLAGRDNYKNYAHISTDADLNSLHDSKNWQSLLESVKQNKEKSEVNLNRPLAARLDSIFKEDQDGRLQIDKIAKKYGWQSIEMETLMQTMKKKDADNQITVKNILDRYGWLGPDIVGDKGNMALSLVIQHAELTTQKKYLPMMRDAVQNGKAQGSSLALLEDRVALLSGKKQTYGSQIAMDQDTKRYYVKPLEDPDNVDKRRAAVGLPPMSAYVRNWNLKWDVEQYKKDLKAIEEKDRPKPGAAH